MIFVIGGRGRLGQALSQEYARQNLDVLSRSVYQDWWIESSKPSIRRYFLEKIKKESVIFVTSGILDPKAPSDDLLKVNYFLPKNIIEVSNDLGIKVVTFGTIMEDLAQRNNNYINSKVALSEFVAEKAINDYRVTHLRIHTLYGVGEPSKFMFLGQMIDAIQNNHPFLMTQGKQLREYHHVDDEVKAIRNIVDSNIYGVMNLNHGQPIMLRDLAEHVFSSVLKKDLLKIGLLPEPDCENYEHTFIKPQVLEEIPFRESLPAVLDYIKSRLLQVLPISCYGKDV